MLVLIVATLLMPLAAEARQARKVYRLAFLGSTSPSGYASQMNAFRGGSSTLSKGHVGAIAVEDDAMLLAHAERIADLASKHQLPTIGFVEYARAGGLLAFGVNFPDLWRRAASFVDGILRGARPADIPVEQPTKFVLVINLKTAKTLGITVPPSVLLRADEVIQ